MIHAHEHTQRPLVRHGCLQAVPSEGALCHHSQFLQEGFQADLAWYILGSCTMPGNMLLHVFSVKWYVTWHCTLCIAFGQASLRLRQMLCITSLWHGVQFKTRECQQQCGAYHTNWIFLRNSNYCSLVKTKKSVVIKLPQCTRPAPFVVYIVGLTFWVNISCFHTCFILSCSQFVCLSVSAGREECAKVDFLKLTVADTLGKQYNQASSTSTVKNPVFWILKNCNKTLECCCLSDDGIENPSTVIGAHKVLGAFYITIFTSACSKTLSYGVWSWSANNLPSVAQVTSECHYGRTAMKADEKACAQQK